MPDIPSDFESLAASRRAWNEQILRAWCQRVPLKLLRQAEQEWFDLAGRADPAATLWTWAWERFPAIVHADLSGVDETWEVRIRLQNGSMLTGYPDARQSLRGMLTLVRSDGTGGLVQEGPVSLDDILAVERL